MSETVDQIYQDNKDIEDVRALIQESKEIEKLAPPMIAFRATGTMTTQAADPGKSDHVMCFWYFSWSLYVVCSRISRNSL